MTLEEKKLTTLNKEKTDFKYKADSTLEREARDIVRKQIERYFSK